MAEYKIGKAVVRIHGEVDPERLAQAIKTFYINKEDKNNGNKRNQH